MSQVCAILSEKRYTPTALKLATDITKLVQERYNQWIVSFQCLLNQSEVDVILSGHVDFAKSVILTEKERVTTNQRLLLEVERSRVIEKRSAVAMKQKRNNVVVSRIKEVIVDIYNKRLGDFQKGNMMLPEGLEEFLSFAYTQSLNLKKLHEVAEKNRGLHDALIELANNNSYCKRVNKTSKNICCVKTAIGFIGIDTCKELYPLLMVKSSLCWSDDSIPLIAPKLWQSVIVTGNAARNRLASCDYKEPSEGVVIGTMRHLGRFVINNMFASISKEALARVKQEFREAGQMEEAYACVDITPKPGVLREVFSTWSDKLTLQITNEINWGQSLHLKKAIIEDIEGVPVLDRSMHGVALGQANIFTIHHLMSQSNSFKKEHSTAYFANLLLSSIGYRQINLQDPGKINISRRA